MGSHHPDPHRHLTNRKVANTVHGNGVFDVKLGFGLFNQFFALIECQLLVAIVSEFGNRPSVIVVTYLAFKGR